MADDEPTSGRAMMMKLDFETNRIEARDAAVARSLAAEWVEREFDPAKVEDMADVHRILYRIAENVAYAAIQKERELHLGDMELLRKWTDARHFELLTKPQSFVVPDPKAP